MGLSGAAYASPKVGPVNGDEPRNRRTRRRHGRGPRGPLAWPPVPAMRSRAEGFDDLVVDAATRLERNWGRPFPAFELGVEDVPPSDPAPWEHDEVPLGRFFAADTRRDARVVIYRRPIETRVQSPQELGLLVDEVVAEQLAALLGVRPRDLDPRYDEE
ncbi:MAG: metallopeptidase family protein [Actinomycetales bacterium]|nr:metallopeptidase family protein [Candidatus Phosphoribacter baldrii]